MNLQLHYFEGCPGHIPTLELAREVLADMGMEAEIEEIDVKTNEQAQAIGFRGSPTLLVDGRDIEDRRDTIGGMGCRVYDGNPIPERWLVESAVLRALGLRNFLFMCVRNSARSLLAEAIARHVAPPGVTIQSAGSQPAFVRPQVIQVLEEAGISPEGLSSKSVEDIDSTGVEAVVTLCADEVCPIYLGRAQRLHWSMPDPVVVEPKDEMLDAFRKTRDELMKRLEHLFADAPE